MTSNLFMSTCKIIMLTCNIKLHKHNCLVDIIMLYVSIIMLQVACEHIYDMHREIIYLALVGGRLEQGHHWKHFFCKLIGNVAKHILIISATVITCIWSVLIDCWATACRCIHIFSSHVDVRSILNCTTYFRSSTFFKSILQFSSIVAIRFIWLKILGMNCFW